MSVSMWDIALDETQKVFVFPFVIKFLKIKFDVFIRLPLSWVSIRIDKRSQYPFLLYNNDEEQSEVKALLFGVIEPRGKAVRMEALQPRWAICSTPSSLSRMPWGSLVSGVCPVPLIWLPLQQGHAAGLCSACLCQHPQLSSCRAAPSQAGTSLNPCLLPRGSTWQLSLP